MTTPTTIDFHTCDAEAWSLSAEDLFRRVVWRRKDGRKFAAAVARNRFAAFLQKPTVFPTLTDPKQAIRRVLWSADATDLTRRSALCTAAARGLSGKSWRRKKRSAELRDFLDSEFTAAEPASPYELLVLLTLLGVSGDRLTGGALMQLTRVALLSSRAHAVGLDHEPPAPDHADVRLVRRGSCRC